MEMLEKLIIIELMIIGFFVTTRRGEILQFITWIPFMIIDRIVEKVNEKKSKVGSVPHYADIKNDYEDEYKKWEKVLQVVIWIFKPFFLCIPCMSSVYGGTYYFLALRQEYGFWNFFLFVFALAGLGYLVDYLLFREEEPQDDIGLN